MAGRSIRLFLVDGTPQGMRTAEVGNWTGLALVCPRTDLARLAQRPEITKTGVYILVGPSESAASGMRVYVGEGDEVWSRLARHEGSKDFWTYVVVFISKDENLTKAHVRWLEATLVREIKKAKCAFRPWRSLKPAHRDHAFRSWRSERSDVSLGSAGG